MVKLILTQIVKDEAHVIERMLNSIKTIVDGICIVDTGSTDNTIDIINKWGEDNGVETYVFERPFDNFENSRNESFEKAREMFLGKKDDKNTYYNFWLDADEQLEIDPKFNKQKLDKDLYMFNTYINTMKYTRNEMCRLDKQFRFYGPVHEFIIPPKDDTNITSGLLDGVTVRVKMDGGSWQADIPAKYKSHAHSLEKHIDADRSDPRWIFYTAQSYHDSACVPDNKEENEERLRRSMNYYKERVSRPDGYYEEIFYAQFRIGTIMRSMEQPWNLCLNELLKAYSMDPLRGEPIKAIVDYYLALGEWNNAYLYSSIGKKLYHGKNPYPQRLLFVDETLYIWKFLESHAAACFYTQRKSESKETYLEMIKISKEKPQYFTPEDLQKIQSNAQFFI
jgi:glycosyltransferase involved in cell wall biosynthesis